MRPSSRQLRLPNFLLHSFPSMLYTFIGPLYSRPSWVNNILAQSHTTGIRAYSLSRFGSNEHREYLVDTGGTNQSEQLDCARLGELLRHHTVHVCVRQWQRRCRGVRFAPDAGMTEDPVDSYRLRDRGSEKKFFSNGAKARGRHESRTYSSGAVGSSVNQGLISASIFKYSMACGTSRTW